MVYIKDVNFLQQHETQTLMIINNVVNKMRYIYIKSQNRTIIAYEYIKVYIDHLKYI